MNLTLEYFKPHEFACKCGKCGGGIDRMDPWLLQLIDRARERAGVPFVITSGYRCPTHNRNVGGVADSAHVYGLAVDIRTATSQARFAVVKALLSLSARRIGISFKGNFVHVDVDEGKPQDVIWPY